MATAPKKTNKDSHKKQHFSLVVSMLLFVLAIVGFLGMAHPLNLEPFDTFNDVMKYMLGRWHILLPFIFLIMSGRILLGIRMRWNTSFVSFIILAVCAPALFHHIRIPMQEELIPTNLIHGGGLWGGIIALILHKTVGQYGTFIILAAGCLTAIALLIPWGQWLSSNKRDEEYEEFLKETEKIGERSQKKQAKNFEQIKAAEKYTPAISQRPSLPVENNVPRQNVYQDDEFDSFTEGIKPEGTFKRILNFGGTKETPYTQEDIKAEIERDPVQIPEWEENPKRETILRPAISYGQSEPQSQGDPIKLRIISSAADKEEPAETHAGEQETVPAEPQVKAYQPIINNPYHKKIEQEAETPVEAPEGSQNAAKPVQEYQSELGKSATQKDSDEIQRATSAPKGQEQSTKPQASVKPEQSADITQEEEKPSLIIRRPDGSANATTATTAATVAAVNNAALAAANGQEATQEPPKPKYIFPPYDLLSLPPKKDTSAGDAEIMQQCSVLEQTLADFKVRAKVVAATRGPAVTQFEIQPAPGVKVNSVVNLSDDIALRLAAPGVRMEAPIPGKSAIGIEVPNLKTDPVSFREVVDTDVVRKKDSKLCIGLGKDINGHIITADIAKMPHMLIAGSTGSGKSVCINTIICGILYKALPEEVKLILVDPKVVELSVYDGIPHLLTPVVTEPKKAASALHWAVAEMERRYKLFADNQVRNIDGYNRIAKEKMPFIVIIIDEMADLMATVKADIETAIMRLAAKARAAGIHMILATQRPSVDVITGVLKNNIPSRIAFAVTSLIDSRTILDSAGAEKLLGKGDMLFAPSGSPKPTRVQGSFVSDDEVGKIVDFIIAQSIPTAYSDEVTSVELESDKKAKDNTAEVSDEPPSPTDDPLFEKALMLVLDTGQASASMMQRRFSIGYNRAARLVDTMAELGVVGKSMGSKPREVIMSRQEAEERFLNKE